MWSDLSVDGCSADPGGGVPEDVESASSASLSSSSFSFRSCWGFSVASRQAAAVVPFFSRSALRVDTVHDHLLVYCLGSWCVVRGPASGGDAASSAGVFAPLKGSLHFTSDSEVNPQKVEPDKTCNVSPTPHSAHITPPHPLGPPSPSYSERVFLRHHSKVNLLVYSQALDLCLSAEQQTTTKGSGALPVCRLWSPHTLEEAALVQLPFKQEVTAAQFSANGSLLLLLLSDPQHSLAVYFNVSQTVQRRLPAEAHLQAASALPVLRPTHVTPCTRSLLNGLTLESSARLAGLCSFSRCRSKWRGSSSVGTPQDGGDTKSESGSKYSNGEGALIRFATFGLGHLRLWSVNSERPSQLPSHKSLCISRLGGGGEGTQQTGALPEATACTFLPSGDIIAALADRRIVVFRGLAPLRSVSVPSCSSKILLLQPLQKSLLLLVAQEGIVQLLPLGALTSPTGNATPSLAGSGRRSSACSQLPQDKPQVAASRPNTATCTRMSLRLPLNTRTTHRRQQGSGTDTTSTIPRRARSPASTRPPAASRSPPFATGSVHAPSRTPRSTYGDSVGRPWSSGGTRRHSLSRASSAPGNRRSFTRRLSKTATLYRSPSAVSRTSTRSSTCRNSQLTEQQAQKRTTSTRLPRNPHQVEVTSATAVPTAPAAAMRELLPKRSLTTQQVATRHLHSLRVRAGEGSTWLPLHSSQVLAAFWSEPLLLLSTRTQLVLLDALHLSEESSLVLQERPLGSLDVSALLSLPRFPRTPPGGTPPAYSMQTTVQDSHHQQVLRPPADGSSVVVTGGRCCVGGELRLWEFHSLSRSTLPLYFKSPITAVAAAATRGEAQGLVAAGTEEGTVILLALQQSAEGTIDPPVVSLDRQITPRCVSALGLDGGRGILAVASTAGHVNCFRLISLPHHVSADSTAVGSLLGSRGPCVEYSSKNSKASTFTLDMELIATLHVPFATPPKLLRFGQCSRYEDHLLVTGLNAPPSVFSIPDGRLLVSSLTEDAQALDSFVPLSLPTAVVVGPEGTSRSSGDPLHEVLYETIAKGNRNMRVLPAPLLLTACIGQSRICLAYETERRMLVGMQVSCSVPAQKAAPQQPSQQDQSSSYCGVENVWPACRTCNEQQTPNQKARYHRGAGLASLFRDLGRAPSSESVLSASASKQSNLKLNRNSDPLVAKRLEDAIIQFVSAKLPHASVPTALLYYVQLEQHDVGCSVSKSRRCPSVTFLSLAADGYILSWSYNVSQRSEHLEQTHGSTNNNTPTFQPINLKGEGEQPAQPCCQDASADPCTCTAARIPESVQNSTSTSLYPNRNPIEQGGSASLSQCSQQMRSGTLCGYPKDSLHPGSTTCLPAGSAASCDDNTQERASRVSCLPSPQLKKPNEVQGTCRGSAQEPMQEKHNLSALKDASHRFLYRAAEHQNSFEVEVVLPGGTIESVRREFATNTLLFSGRLNDPTWRIQLPGDPATCRLRLRVPLKFRISSNAVTVDQNFANGHIYVSIQR